MSYAKRGLQSDILHIRPESPQRGPAGASVQAVEAMLESLLGEVDMATDVYRGLALLGMSETCTNSGKLPTRAVLVCVNDLGPPELEFFSVVARVRPDLPVYVYGEEHFGSKISRAIELGASGVANEGVIRSAIAAAVPSLDKPPQKVVEPQDPPPVESTMIRREPESASAPVETSLVEDQPETPPTPSVVEEAVDAGPSEESASPEEPSPDTVPVPWLRRSNGPKRIAPGRTPPPTETSANEPVDEDIQDGSLDEPLLTSAELQALIGDDIAAIAPEERFDDDLEDDQNGEGKS
ncbi:MAG: hypothetical protein JSU63_18965 [Phycisphaerales bacterium]|nr:MAG: hypothetical protein JSU63_18965 [Phycisphaerales bacterium]